MLSVAGTLTCGRGGRVGGGGGGGQRPKKNSIQKKPPISSLLIFFLKKMCLMWVGGSVGWGWSGCRRPPPFSRGVDEPNPDVILHSFQGLRVACRERLSFIIFSFIFGHSIAIPHFLPCFSPYLRTAHDVPQACPPCPFASWPSTVSVGRGKVICAKSPRREDSEEKCSSCYNIVVVKRSDLGPSA